RAAHHAARRDGAAGPVAGAGREAHPAVLARGRPVERSPRRADREAPAGQARRLLGAGGFGSRPVVAAGAVWGAAAAGGRAFPLAPAAVPARGGALVRRRRATDRPARAAPPRRQRRGVARGHAVVSRPVAPVG